MHDDDDIKALLTDLDEPLNLSGEPNRDGWCERRVQSPYNKTLFLHPRGFMVDDHSSTEADRWVIYRAEKDGKQVPLTPELELPEGSDWYDVKDAKYHVMAGEAMEAALSKDWDYEAWRQDVLERLGPLLRQAYDHGASLDLVLTVPIASSPQRM